MYKFIFLLQINDLCRISYMFVTKTRSNSNDNDDDDDRLVFDITDDESGRLHNVARFHIPPFVNEVTDPNNSKNNNINISSSTNTNTNTNSSNSNENKNHHYEEEQSVYPAFDCQGTYLYMSLMRSYVFESFCFDFILGCLSIFLSKKYTFYIFHILQSIITSMQQEPFIIC